MLNTETLVRHCLVGAHAAGCAQAEPQTATEKMSRCESRVGVKEDIEGKFPFFFGHWSN